MKAHIVLLDEVVIFVATCSTDAHLVSKRVPGSRIVECRLNSSTDEGSRMLASISANDYETSNLEPQTSNQKKK